MSRSKRIFISDFHLSSQDRYDDSNHGAWYKPDIHNKRLLGFLNGYVSNNSGSIKDLILVGDIFNNQVCPVDVYPPTYSEIFNANKDVIAALKSISQSGIALFYINGNHDFDLELREIKSVLPEVKVIKNYHTGRVHAEHGHKYDIFNKIDYYSDPAWGRPIGYFISRLITTIDGSGYGILDLVTYLDDILESAVTTQNIFGTIIEGLAERAGLNDSGIIKMPNKRTITVAEVKARYNKLGDVYGVGELMLNLFERRHLNGPADRLCKKGDINIVIFGHTHKAMIDKDFFLVDDRIYANTGSWCKKNAYFVEIDKEPNKPTSVELLSVDLNGVPSSEKTETL